MNQHPPGSINNPLHASTLNKLVDATDYRSGSGKQWVRTVCGTAFHAIMRDYLTTRKITKDCLAYLKEAIAAERDGVAWGRDQNESWAWGLIHHWFTAITTKWAPPKGPLFCEWSFLLSIPINGQDVWFEGTADLIAPEAAEIIDYKTGSKPPDHTHSAQHHLYCLAARYALWSNPKHHADRHQLDWATITEPLRKFGVVAPRFTYLLLDRMVGASAGAWSMPGFARDFKGMREDDSLAYITELTKRYLDQQPTRLAVAIPAEPPQDNEMGNPQTTAIIPAQNHKVALEVSENIDVFQLGEVFSKSKFFKDCADANQAVVKILAGRELGLPPFQSMSGIHVIQGKATMGATLIAARIKGSGKYDYTVNQMADTKCEVEFFELRDGKRISIGKSEFSDADARKAGTQNMGKFPRNMLFARAISNGAKWFTPDIFGGPIYVPEEMQQDEPAAEPIKSVAVEVAPAPEQPVAPQFTWGEPRGEGFATDAQIKRIKANCDALGFGPKKVLVTAVNLGAPKEITSVADVTEKVATQLVLKLDALLKSTETPRPEREKTEAERIDEQVRQIVGEMRTRRAKELAELVRSGPLSANEIIDIMANEAAPDTQFSALAEEVQEQVLHTIKRAAQAAADRVAMPGNGHK